MSVHIDALPEWAKDAILNCPYGKIVQMVGGGHTLSIYKGVASFNGHSVVLKGGFVEEEIILLSSLPAWARRVIRRAGKAGSALEIKGNDTLHVSKGQALFNGKRVVRKIPQEDKVVWTTTENPTEREGK